MGAATLVMLAATATAVGPLGRIAPPQRNIPQTWVMTWVMAWVMAWAVMMAMAAANSAGAHGGLRTRGFTCSAACGRVSLSVTMSSSCTARGGTPTYQ